jgi:hypothetical protein
MIAYTACPGELVGRVELVRQLGQVVGDEDDVVIWAISRLNQEPRSSFVVGRTTPGFREVVPLSSPPPKGVRLAAIVTTSEVADVYTTFDAGELRSGEFLSSAGYLSPTEFQEAGTEACK